MRRLAIIVVAVGTLLAGTAVQGLAETDVSGSTAQSSYRIVVPDAWNGDLVIWNHGFDLDPPGPGADLDLGPLAELQLAQGYAVAASSYQQNGWAVFKTKNDLQHLYNTFVSEFGHPDEVIVTGASLGGIVSAQAIESAHLGNVVGSYSVCGAVAGSRNWDGAFDLRLVYDVVSAGVPGGFIPGGADGLPEGSTLTQTDVVLALNATTGVLLPAALRTAEQQANLDTLTAVTQLPESFLVTDMIFATFGLSNLVQDQGKLAGKNGLGNVGIDYGDATINAEIERVAPNPGAANRLHKRYTPTGDVGDTKIVTLHTDKDGLVIVENQHEYAEVVPSANLTTAIVVEAVPSHCGFTSAEVVAGWEALRGWVSGGPQPTAATIQGTCLAVESLFGGPCRIDPGFVVPDMDGRVRPR